jgi:hypothetical protein
VALEERPACGVVHDEKRRAILLYSKVKDAHNVGVLQACESLRLIKELLHLLVFERGVQDFERGTTLEVAMLAEVDFGEAASP